MSWEPKAGDRVRHRGDGTEYVLEDSGDSNYPFQIREGVYMTKTRVLSEFAYVVTTPPSVTTTIKQMSHNSFEIEQTDSRGHVMTKITCDWQTARALVPFLLDKKALP